MSKVRNHIYYIKSSKEYDIVSIHWTYINIKDSAHVELLQVQLREKCQKPRTDNTRRENQTDRSNQTT